MRFQKTCRTYRIFAGDGKHHPPLPRKITTYLLVYNIPEYAYDYPFWTVRISDQNLWFYGAYSSLSQATHCAKTVNGIVLPVRQQQEEP